MYHQIQMTFQNKQDEEKYISIKRLVVYSIQFKNIESIVKFHDKHYFPFNLWSCYESFVFI